MTAEICAGVGDQDRAEEIRSLLLPQQDLIAPPAVGVWVRSPISSASSPRFSVPSTTPTADFANAATRHEQIPAPTLLARTRLEWARMLLTRRGPGDGERARSCSARRLAPPGSSDSAPSSASRPRCCEDSGDRPASGLVAVLFTDLVGSTELMWRLGEGAFDELRRRHFAALPKAVEPTAAGGQGPGRRDHGRLRVGRPRRWRRRWPCSRRRTGRRWTAPLAIRVGVSVGDVTFEDDDVLRDPGRGGGPARGRRRRRARS